MKNRITPIACATLIFLFVLPLFCGAATIYVRTDGNDNNDGLTNTPSGAKATFLGALFAIGDGDTVVFAPGTYNDLSGYNVNRSNVTFRGSDPNNRAVMAGLSLYIAAGASGDTFENLVFDGVLSVTDIIVIADGAQNLTLRNCELKNCSVANSAGDDLRHGLLILEGCNGLLLENCQLDIHPDRNISDRVHLMIARFDDFETGRTSSNLVVRNTSFYSERLLSQTTDDDAVGIYLRHNINGFLIEGCTFETLAETVRIVSTDGALAPRTFQGITMRNNGIQRAEMLNAVYFGSNNVYQDFKFQDNYVTNVRSSAFWLSGGGVSTMDGCEFSGNVYDDVGFDDSATNRAISMDEVIINTTPGKETVIRNNRIVRPTVGADECIWLNLAGSGVVFSDNVISNYQATALVLDGAESLAGAGSLSNVIISGNVLPNLSSNGIGVRGLSETVTNVAIENNTMSNAAGRAMEVSSANIGGASFRFNRVQGCQTGIRVSAPGTNVSYNDVFDTQSTTTAGILLNEFVTPSDVSNSIVAWNIVAGNRNHGISLDPVLSATSTNVTVMNNTVVGNLGTAVRVGLNNCHVWNNIIAFNSSTGLSLEATTPGAFGYNLLYNVLTGGVDYVGLAGTPLVGDLLANPRFEDLQGRDYHLRVNSPAIGAGASHGSGTTLQPDGSDLGALPTHTLNLAVPASAWTLYR